MILGLYLLCIVVLVVEVAPGVDEEGLEVAKECLGEAFKVHSDSSRDDRLKPISLINLFTSLDKSEPPPPPPVAAIQDPSSSSGPDFSGSHVSVDTSKEPLFTGKFWFVSCSLDQCEC